MTQDMKTTEFSESSMSRRVVNALRSYNIFAPIELEGVSVDELKRIPDLGAKGVKEVVLYCSYVGVEIIGKEQCTKKQQQQPWVKKLIDEAIKADRQACAERAWIALVNHAQPWDVRMDVTNAILNRENNEQD